MPKFWKGDSQNGSKTCDRGEALRSAVLREGTGLGAKKRRDGYLEGNGYIVSWCVGHLVELAEPEEYDEKYAKWRYENLPILPQKWKYEISPGTKKQFLMLKGLMNRNDVTTITCTTDDGVSGGVTKDTYQRRDFITFTRKGLNLTV